VPQQQVARAPVTAECRDHDVRIEHKPHSEAIMYDILEDVKLKGRDGAKRRDRSYTAFQRTLLDASIPGIALYRLLEAIPNLA
jgi:hypothetical protein